MPLLTVIFTVTVTLMYGTHKASRVSPFTSYHSLRAHGPRFAPAGVLPPGCPPPPPHARSATPGGGAGEDGANTGPRGSGGTQRGRKGPQAKGTSKGRKRARDEADKEAPSGRGDPGAGPSNAVAVPRSSEAAGACGGQGAPAGAAREAGQQSARVCDLMFLHVYYPHKSRWEYQLRASPVRYGDGPMNTGSARRAATITVGHV